MVKALFKIKNILLYEVISILVISGLASEVFSINFFFSYNISDLDIEKLIKIFTLSISSYCLYLLQSILNENKQKAIIKFTESPKLQKDPNYSIEKRYSDKLSNQSMKLNAYFLLSIVSLLIYLVIKPLLKICFN